MLEVEPFTEGIPERSRCACLVTECLLVQATCGACATFGFIPRLHCYFDAKQAVDSRTVEEAADNDTSGLMEICDTIWAQSGHNRRKQKGPASLQALDLMVAGAGFEPATFGL